MEGFIYQGSVGSWLFFSRKHSIKMNSSANLYISLSSVFVVASLFVVVVVVIWDGEM